jgi:hypothetical protein
MFTLALSLIAAAPWLLQFALNYVPNVAIPETISGVSGAIWSMTMGYLIMKDNARANN